MDSVTRFAMAQREIGLAIGEPPATRGYTPSVFALLPRLLERAGAGESGAITALYTVLVEGDDMNEPVADTVRGILDGHIVLSRALAHANHYPAVDVLESVSRLTRDICAPDEVELAARAREHLALFKKNEDLITVGAYQAGASVELDRAVGLNPGLRAFLRQSVQEATPRADSYRRLRELLGKS
jgi:flagellum-specific ATP synthase